MKIALAYNFEALSAHLIEEALKLALSAKAKVYLLHIAAPDPHLLSYTMRESKLDPKREAELSAERRILKRLAQRFSDAGLECEVIIEQGNTVELLLQQIAKIKADYLVIGHHEEKGFLRYFIDSAAHKLLKSCPIPVLVVPLKD